MTKLTQHPMDVNANTRIRWDVLKQRKFSDDVLGKSLLDVGSGLGYFSLRYKEMGANVLSTDIDQAALDHIQKCYGIRTMLLDVVNDPLPDEKFDVIFIGEVLEHVVDPDSLIRKIKNNLHVNGKIIVSTPAMEGAFIHTKGKALGHQHGAEKHERDGFYKVELEEMFRSNGMKVTAYRSCVYYLSELFMQVTKYFYFLKCKTYAGQSDVMNIETSLIYKSLRLVFPLLMAVFRCEQYLLSATGFSGHCHIMSATRQDCR